VNYKFLVHLSVLKTDYGGYSFITIKHKISNIIKGLSFFRFIFVVGENWKKQWMKRYFVETLSCKVYTLLNRKLIVSALLSKPEAKCSLYLLCRNVIFTYFAYLVAKKCLSVLCFNRRTKYRILLTAFLSLVYSAEGQNGGE
jgi:hypothetical protein